MRFMPANACVAGVRLKTQGRGVKFKLNGHTVSLQCHDIVRIDIYSIYNYAWAGELINLIRSPVETSGQHMPLAYLIIDHEWCVARGLTT